MFNDPLKEKKIILGVTGGIAAYKSALIVRELITRGAEVKVIMTPAALEFITPLTLSSLSRNKVIVNTFPDDQSKGTDYDTWHIDYALWGDLMIIAPATINTVAKIVNGFADNALTTVVSALRCPLLVAPAADMDMYNNPITQENISKLSKLNSFIVNAEDGFLASGLSGEGRMASIDKIIDAAEIVLSGVSKDLVGRKILVTAGPTYEDIDPVRYIGNRSSGKMGYAIAKAAYLRGAGITLISGATDLSIYPEIKKINVRSAEEMKKAVDEEIVDNDVLIMSAAVADYKPEIYSDKKIKKEEGLIDIKLTKTEDILSTLKKEGKKIVGFALESSNAIENASKKLQSKKIDMIVVNSLEDEGAGFEHDSNKIVTLSRNGDKKEFPLASKFQTANFILTELKSLL